MPISEEITHGVPSISSNCPVGPNDLVKDGINGYLYQLHNVDQLHQIKKIVPKECIIGMMQLFRIHSFSIENYIQQLFKFFGK